MGRRAGGTGGTNRGEATAHGTRRRERRGRGGTGGAGWQPAIRNQMDAGAHGGGVT